MDYVGMRGNSSKGDSGPSGPVGPFDLPPATACPVPCLPLREAGHPFGLCDLARLDPGRSRNSLRVGGLAAQKRCDLRRAEVAACVDE